MHTFYLVARKQRFTYNRQNWQNIVSTIAHHQRRGRAPDSAHYRKMSRTLRVDELLQDGRRTLKKPSPAQDPSPPNAPREISGGHPARRRRYLHGQTHAARAPRATLAFSTCHAFAGVPHASRFRWLSLSRHVPDPAQNIKELRDSSKDIPLGPKTNPGPLIPKPRVALGPTLTLSSLGRREFAKRMLFLSVIVAVVVAAIVVLVVAIVAINISVVVITIVVAMIVITLITITIIVAIVVVTIAVITTTVTCTIVTVIAPS